MTAIAFDDDRRDALLRSQARYYKAAMGLISLIAIVVVTMLGLIVWELSEARAGREQIADCIRPEGKCAQRSGQQGASLISASIVCTSRRVQTREQALACIRDVMAP